MVTSVFLLAKAESSKRNKAMATDVHWESGSGTHIETKFWHEPSLLMTHCWEELPQDPRGSPYKLGRMEGKESKPKMNDNHWNLKYQPKSRKKPEQTMSRASMMILKLYNSSLIMCIHVCSLAWSWLDQEKSSIITAQCRSHSSENKRALGLIRDHPIMCQTTISWLVWQLLADLVRTIHLDQETCCMILHLE